MARPFRRNKPTNKNKSRYYFGSHTGKQEKELQGNGGFTFAAGVSYHPRAYMPQHFGLIPSAGQSPDGPLLQMVQLRKAMALQSALQRIKQLESKDGT